MTAPRDPGLACQDCDVTHDGECDRATAGGSSGLFVPHALSEHPSAAPQAGGEGAGPSDLPYPVQSGGTHWAGCWLSRGHHNCAVTELWAASARIDHLTAEVARLREERETTNAAARWVAGGDTGASSLAIWSHMMGVDPRTRSWGAAYPLDPDDFGRCYRLLWRIPEWRARVGEMACYGPVWAALANAWEELTALYEADVGAGLDDEGRRFGRSAPRLYDRMRIMTAPAAPQRRPADG